MLTVAAWRPPFDCSTLTGFVGAADVRAEPGEVLLLRLTSGRNDTAAGDGQ